MTAAPDPTTNVAVELAQLRGEINTGLEAIKGTLGILVERTSRTDADVRQLRTDMETELQKLRDDELRTLKAEVEALKQGRWPLTQIGALTAVAAVVAAIIALFLH
ncbi:hypothetical protein LXH13_06055 [Streptomyces spinosirectus]|jgi:hypothetical protein|uniref:hypothetical protein n=1 Tax=Streptomyces TaxID=1883 RepID=UPI000FFE4B75|nr:MULTISPECIES: hypothetical protein [Streptomyces]MBY8342032.1 hypothetical protein [Streptomyces plumbidurans]UIR16622.1 hypothetical protein LXH13_06055 [Streptomyces spinosirectus]